MSQVSPPTTASQARFPIRLFILVIALFAGFTLYVQWQTKVVPFEVAIEVDGETREPLTTKGGTVGEILAAAGIAVGPYDALTPSIDETVTPETEVRIKRALPIHIAVDGDRVTHWVTVDTVREALATTGITLNTLDRVVPSQGSGVTHDMEIKVIRVVEEFIEETETLPFKVVRWAAPELERGQTQVMREGREGIIKNRVRIVYEDGKPVNRSIVGSEVIQSVVDRVIGEGTRAPTQTVDTPNGPLPYLEVREMEATGYEPGPISTGEWADGLTFTGLKAERGVIAVDPTVIPLGTRLYVEGYGEGIAADIGGAIKGNRLDLCFDTYNEAIQWGRRMVKVYILGP